MLFCITDDVEDIKITPDDFYVNYGDDFKCVADGNPEPTYRWKDMKNTGNETVEGSYLYMDKDIMQEGKHRWQCQATNKVGNNHNHTIEETITFDGNCYIIIIQIQQH